MSLAVRLVSAEPVPYNAPAEIGLWCAVVTQAFEDAGGGGVTSGQPIDLGRQARALGWIRSSRTDEGSFLWCCENLGLDPAAVRRQVAR